MDESDYFWKKSVPANNNNNNNKTLDTGQWNVLPSIRKLCLSHRSQILQKDDEPKQG